jgi:hypothetical protein
MAGDIETTLREGKREPDLFASDLASGPSEARQDDQQEHQETEEELMYLTGNVELPRARRERRAGECEEHR